MMPRPQEAFWDKRAAKYDAETVKGPNYAARLDRVSDWLGPAARLLDVGCASGEITLDLAERLAQVRGIDTSGKLIELAEKKRAERGITNARFSQAAPSDASLEVGSFDGITAFSVLHLADNPERMLARFQELLKPGGKLILETPCLGDWFFAWKLIVRLAMLTGYAPQVRCLRVAELEAMLASAGFELIESKVYNPKSGMQAMLAAKR